MTKNRIKKSDFQPSPIGVLFHQAIKKAWDPLLGFPENYQEARSPECDADDLAKFIAIEVAEVTGEFTNPEDIDQMVGAGLAVCQALQRAEEDLDRAVEAVITVVQKA